MIDLQSDCKLKKFLMNIKMNSLELKTDSSAKDIFDEKSLTEFWPLMINSYPKVTEKALRVLIPFVSTYLCESGFSTLLQIKSNQRNRLDVENYMCCALSKISPRIMDLVRNNLKFLIKLFLASPKKKYFILKCIKLYSKI